MPLSQSPLLDDPETPSERSFYNYLALALLFLIAAHAAYWSHFRLMDGDEFLSYHGDSAATLADVVRIQLHYPISLDPPAYHLLSHLSMDLLGRNEMALRLPALLGFLLLPIGLFLFVRRLAGSRAAIVALLLPVASTLYRYSMIGRPYGLLLGLYAMSLAFWQMAARRCQGGKPRLLALIGISVSLALAITSHYFGVLILVPICFAELARTLHRHRLDFGVLAAILVGMSAVAITLPFRKAVMVYRQHYYMTHVDTGIIQDAYRAIFFRYPNWAAHPRRALGIAVLAAMLVLAIAAWHRYGRRAAGEPSYEWAALLAIAALPFFGYLFGHFVTHTMEIRYVGAWQFAVMACIAITMQGLLRRDLVFWGAVIGILLAGWLLQQAEVLFNRADRARTLASMVIPPELSQAILSHPNRRIYIQALGNFFTDEHYQPDPAIRERLSFVYGEDQELAWFGHNTNVITAQNMAHFTRLSLVPYTQVLADPAPLVVVYHTGWDWIEQDLQERHRRLVFLGPLFGGALFEVQPPAPPDLQPKPPLAAPAAVH